MHVSVPILNLILKNVDVLHARLQLERQRAEYWNEVYILLKSGSTVYGTNMTIIYIKFDTTDHPHP